MYIRYRSSAQVYSIWHHNVLTILWHVVTFCDVHWSYLPRHHRSNVETTPNRTWLGQQPEMFARAKTSCTPGLKACPVKTRIYRDQTLKCSEGFSLFSMNGFHCDNQAFFHSQIQDTFRTLLNFVIFIYIHTYIYIYFMWFLLICFYIYISYLGCFWYTLSFIYSSFYSNIFLFIV